MKRRIAIILIALGAAITVGAQNESVFDRFFASAQQFAHAWPREKVYLHFDNTSYYQGDTIWFKATVVNAATLQLSPISKPLYVELVDQLGNVKERQIVKLDNGTGHGQISLANAFFTGYYEIRAYTKWMLAFSDDPQYFSQTFPVYRKRLSQDEPRSIARYNMDASMKQRPVDKKKGLSVRFFPEGGNLVQGIPSVVGIETLDRDSGWVNITGTLVAADGRQLGPVATVHDGIGAFQCLPEEKPSKVVFEWKGKKQTFELPKALPQGYVMRVNSRMESFDISVTRSAGMPEEPLALFIFTQGVPQSYVPVDFTAGNTKHVKILTDELPAGIVRLALVNGNGQPVADRFTFVYPEDMPQVEALIDGTVFQPYQPLQTVIRLVDGNGQPVADADVSVSVRDGIESDYVSEQDNIFTHLLLTSDLKGYIHKPAFYLANRSAARRKLLDNLLLVRGWRRYDVEQAFGVKTFTPRYMPEDQLTLYGQVRSMLMNREQANLGVTILSQNDTIPFAGTTTTDSLGYFSVPLDDFYGTLESLIQTKKEGKQFNRNTRVRLFRTFEPPLRQLDYCELSPAWDNPSDTLALNQQLDSLAKVGTEHYDAQMLDEVVVKGKHHGNLLKETEAFERDIIAFYDIRQIVDRMRDEGKFVPDDFGNLLYILNPKKINREGSTYGVSKIRFSVNGKLIGQEFINKGTMEMMETAMLYNDIDGRDSYAYSADSYRVTEKEADDFFTNSQTAEQDTTDFTMLNEKYVRCELTMRPLWQAQVNYKPTHGIRHTDIQGYNRPAEFYAPVYPDGIPDFPDDRRRTLFWSPSLRTNNDGEIVIDCYNSFNPTYVMVTAETLVNGQPAAVTASSLSLEK